MARIIIPRNFELQSILGGEVLKRHKELGDKSPLTKVFDMKDLESSKTNSDDHNTKKDELEKPCWGLGWCPYGQLVEEFPLTGGELRCTVFGHDCPAYYHCEEIAEEEE